MTSPSSSSDSGLRASDAERERVAEALRRHHLDGRLDTEELQERLERAYAARTTGELAPLLADLPAEREPARGPRPFAPFGAPPLLLVAVGVLLALATVGAVAHGHPGPLPVVAGFLLLRFAWWGEGPRRRRTAWSPRVWQPPARGASARPRRPHDGAHRDVVLPRRRGRVRRDELRRAQDGRIGARARRAAGRDRRRGRTPLRRPRARVARRDDPAGRARERRRRRAVGRRVPRPERARGPGRRRHAHRQDVRGPRAAAQRPARVAGKPAAAQAVARRGSARRALTVSYAHIATRTTVTAPASAHAARSPPTA